MRHSLQAATILLFALFAGSSAVAAELPADTIVATETVKGFAVERTAGSGSVTAEGAAAYNIPLWVPPGRNGMQPKLGLTYGSREGDGFLGVGWSLSGRSVIRRCRRTALDDGEAQRVEFTDGPGGDRYCLDGERLVAVPSPGGSLGGYGADGTEYRTQRDSFAKIVSSGADAEGPTTFTLYAKDGRILTYGRTPDARLEGPRLAPDGSGWFGGAGSAVRYVWALSRIADRYGNYLTVRYETADLGSGVEQLPLELRYTGSTARPSAPATRRIRFTYEGRPDASSAYVTGLRLGMSQRLASMSVIYQPPGQAPLLLRTYRLTYRNDSGTGRSVLTRVEDCDGRGVCKRPATFGYSSLSEVFTTGHVDDSGNVPTEPKGEPSDIDGDGRDGLEMSPVSERLRTGAVSLVSNWRYVDLNGDGRTDVIGLGLNFSGGLGTPSVFEFTNVISLSTGRRYVPLAHDEANEPPSRFSKPAYAVDLNGDGLPELLTLKKDPESDDFEWAYRPNVAGKLQPYRFTGIREHPIPDSVEAFVPFQTMAVDVNGSGRSSLLFGNGATAGLSLHAGVLRLEPTLGSLPRSGTLYTSCEDRFVDLTGDGLPEWVSLAPTRGALRVAINTGNGFAPPQLWPIPAPFDASPSVDPVTVSAGPRYCRSDSGLRVLDYNKDGRQDLLLGAGYHPIPGGPSLLGVLISTGSGFVARQVGPPGSFVLGPFDTGPVRLGIFASSEVWPAAQVLDVNGDGLDDIASGTAGVYVRTGETPDLLIEAKDGYRTERFAYRPVSDESTVTPGSDCRWPMTCVKRGLSVVARHDVDEGLAAPSFASFAYHYTDPRLDPRGRGFLGFATESITDSRTGASTTLTFNRDATGTSYPCLPIPRRTATRVVLADGTVHQHSSDARCRVVTRREHPNSGGASYFAYADETADREQEGASEPLRLLRFWTSQERRDAYGNVTRRETQSYPIVGGTVVHKPHRDITTAAYDNFAPSWLIGLAHRMTDTSVTSAGDQRVTRTVTQDFDDAGQVRTSRREPTVARGSALYLRTRYRRDIYGNVLVIARSGSGQTRRDRIAYDAEEHTFATRFTDAAGHVSRRVVHAAFGLTAIARDPRGLVTRYQYDGFGRPRSIDRPDAADVTLHYLVHGAGLPRVVAQQHGGHIVETWLDRLGRVVAQKWDGFDGRFAVTTTKYDEMGRVADITLPAFADDPERYQSFSYDALDRPTGQRNPDGSQRHWTYSGLRTSSVDEDGDRAYVLADELGRVRQSAEFASATRPLVTRYRYGPFDSLNTVIDPAGHVAQFGYDRLGRKTRITDRDGGTRITSDDAFGEPTETKDANGARTSYTRDRLGRPTTIMRPEGTTRLKWDTAAHGLGALASASSPDGVRVMYRYDSLGRPKRELWNVRGSSFAIDYGRDAESRLTQLTYPTGGSGVRLRLDYRYTPRGDLRLIRLAPKGTAIWRLTAANAAGQVLEERYGNGSHTSRRYDVNDRLSGIQTTMPNGARLQDLSYVWEPDGDLASRTDMTFGKRGLAEAFTNDALGRLRSWRIIDHNTRRATPTTTFSYTGDGNLVRRRVRFSSEASVSYRYGGPHGGPHAVTARISGRSVRRYRYDAAGNQISAGSRYITPTSFGLPARITQGQSSVRFGYDPFLQRTIRTSGQATTTYIGGIYEERRHAGVTDHVFYVPGLGRTVAQLNQGQSGGLQRVYLHDDHLGSVNAASTDAGDTAEFRYEPFGGARDPQDLSHADQRPAQLGLRVGFLGNERDDAGLLNFNARLYDPATARFVSPDPVLLPGSDPYGYANDRPLASSDPTGLQPDGSEVGRSWSYGPSYVTGELPTPTPEENEPLAPGGPIDPPPPPPPDISSTGGAIATSSDDTGTHTPAGKPPAQAQSAPAGGPPSSAALRPSAGVNISSAPGAAREVLHAGGAPFTGNAGGAPFTGNAASPAQAGGAGGGTPEEHVGLWSRFWSWLRSYHGSLPTHERAEILRKQYGPESGHVITDESGDPVDLDRLSDDEVIALINETQGRVQPADPATVAAIAAGIARVRRLEEESRDWKAELDEILERNADNPEKMEPWEQKRVEELRNLINGNEYELGRLQWYKRYSSKP